MPGEDRDAPSRACRPHAAHLRRLLLFPDDGKRHEIIDGVHYVTPSPRLRHQDLVGRLHGVRFVHLLEHPEAGRVFLAPVEARSYEAQPAVEPPAPEVHSETPDGRSNRCLGSHDRLCSQRSGGALA
jgi:hypothetical protein